MPVFYYKALDPSGTNTEGTLEADNRKDALNRLRARGCKPISIQSNDSPSAKKSRPTSSPQAPQSDTSSQAFSFKRKRSRDALALAFLKQVYQLHKSGMPIGDAIKGLYQRLSDPELKAVASNLWHELSEGHSFAATVRKQSDIFDASAAYLIEAGEATGNLVPVLENIIANLESRIALKKRVISGLAYPALIGVLAMLVTALVLFFLLPRMQDMMSTMGSELSIWASVLVAISEGSLLYAPPLLLILLIASAMTLRWRGTGKGRIATDAWLLQIPIIRTITHKIDLCRITNLMATLLSSGVNTTEALKLTERTINNTQLRERFRQARTLINDGASFSSAFRRHALMSDNDLDILSVGENIGTPSESFREIYEHHNEQLAADFGKLTTVLLASAFGLVFMLVAIIILSVITIVFDMSQSIMPS